MSKRALVALLALVGFFVALYLALYKLGYIGELTCSVGSCETVNTSRWATFLFMPVAMWGVAYYVLVFTVALIGMQERFAESRVVAGVLAALGVWGVLFSGWLTYLELAVIKAVCQWCVVSAVLVTILCALAIWDWLETRAISGSPPPS